MASAMELFPVELDSVAKQRNTILDRIRTAMEKRRITMRELSLAIDMDAGYISQLYQGRVKIPSSTVLASIAQVLQCDVAFLLAQTDTPRSRPLQNIIEIDVIGIVEGGAFRRVNGAMTKTKPRTILSVASRRYPAANHFALDIHDDAMNAAKPALDVGMIALCVDLKTAGIDVQDAGIYVLERSLDGGQTVEKIIRRANNYNDRWEFEPVSTNPMHEKIIVPKHRDASNVTVNIIGKVYGSQAFYEE
jgi:transcriptional regulator with XRE-family HTH domain